MPRTDVRSMTIRSTSQPLDGDTTDRRTVRRTFTALALAAGTAAAIAIPVSASTPAPHAVGVAPAARGGSWEVYSNGSIRNLNNAPNLGSLSSTHLDAPVTGIAATPDLQGFWLVARDGGVFSFGDAKFYGSLAKQHSSQPIVGIAGAADGHGYWLAGGQGRVFGFGDARTYPSRVSGSIVSIASTHAGYGYWLAAADGKVFNFGPAKAYGSAHVTAATGPVVGMVVDRDGAGYWLITANGRVLNYGDAWLNGSGGTVGKAVATVGAGPDGGYSVIDSHGGVETTYGNREVLPPGDAFVNSFTRRNVQTYAVAPDSSTVVSNFVYTYEHIYGAVGVHGLPLITIPANQPNVTLSVANGCYNYFTASTGTSIPIPSDAATVVDQSTDSDSPLIVWQPSTNTEWELWQAHPQANGSWSACWGGKLTGATTSAAVFQYPYGLSASGISYLSTTITEADVAAGYIDHIMAIDVEGCNGMVAPADRTDCKSGGDPGFPSEGTILRFPATLPMPANLTHFGQLVFRAMQRYGAVVTDQSGGQNLQAESTTDWAAEGHAGTDPITAAWDGQPEYGALNNMPWQDLQVVTY